MSVLAIICIAIAGSRVRPALKIFVLDYLVQLHRKCGQGAYPQPPSPYDVDWVNGEADRGKSMQDSLESDCRLRSSKLESKAEVHARSE
jgi:hypothetical protein